MNTVYYPPELQTHHVPLINVNQLRKLPLHYNLIPEVKDNLRALHEILSFEVFYLLTNNQYSMKGPAVFISPNYQCITPIIPRTIPINITSPAFTTDSTHTCTTYTSSSAEKAVSWVIFPCT